jgi:hypothetical protein
MVFVGPVQPAPDQVVDVIAVRNFLVSATGTVRVLQLTVDRIGVVAWVLLIDRDQVLVDVVFVRVVQMTIMEVVDVIVVLNGRVATTGSVLVRVGAFMDLVGHALDLRTSRLIWQTTRDPITAAAT